MNQIRRKPRQTFILVYYKNYNSQNCKSLTYFTYSYLLILIYYSYLLFLFIDLYCLCYILFCIIKLITI